jgi:nucleotide-binding universal stress UspA family protein
MRLLEEKTNTAISLRNILFATDFSAVSEAALPYATAISFLYGSMVHVAHVVPTSKFPVRPGAVDPTTIGSIYEETHTEAQEMMQRLAGRLKRFPHRTYVRHGELWEVLSEIIRDNELDLLVAGTHGRTGVGKLVMGSVAEEIFRQAPCPVLTIGPKVHKGPRLAGVEGNREVAPPEIKFRQILYTTDFTRHSVAAASYAFSLAREFRARLTLLHVIEEYGEYLHDRPGLIEGALRKLEELTPEGAALRYSPEPVVEFGSPADSILETASEREADLIVIGVRAANGRLGAATHLPLATAHRVVTRANCPVLTIRG